MKRVGILSTHPIQHHVPWYRALASSSSVRAIVLYGCIPTDREQGVGFGFPFTWDVDLLSGYDWRRLAHVAGDGDLSRFGGIRARHLRDELEAERLDALVVTGWNSSLHIQGLAVAGSLGIPCLVRGDSHSLRRRSWIRLLALRALVSRFAAFLAVGSANSDFYLSLGAPREAVFRCWNVIDTGRFERQMERDAPRREELRSAMGIPAGSVCFLFVGRLVPEKRIEDLLLAFERACGEPTPKSLLVVGAGPEEERLRRMARDRKLDVRFAGFLNQGQITRAYAAADCLVLPSLSESWGLVVNEAMTCGLPCIVSTGVGSAPDLVERGSTGFLFPPGDVPKLAQCLEAMAARAEARRAMAAEANRRVRRLSQAQVVTGTEEAVRFATS